MPQLSSLPWPRPRWKQGLRCREASTGKLRSGGCQAERPKRLLTWPSMPLLPARPLSLAKPKLRIGDCAFLECLRQLFSKTRDLQRPFWQAIAIDGAISLGAIANQVNRAVTIYVKVVRQRLPLWVAPLYHGVNPGPCNVPRSGIGWLLSGITVHKPDIWWRHPRVDIHPYNVCPVGLHSVRGSTQTRHRRGSPALGSLQESFDNVSRHSIVYPFPLPTKGVNPYDLRPIIEERPAGVAWVQGSLGLDHFALMEQAVSPRPLVTGPNLADDAGSVRPHFSIRVANGMHVLPDLDFCHVPQGQIGQLLRGRLNLEQGQVSHSIYLDRQGSKG